MIVGWPHRWADTARRSTPRHGASLRRYAIVHFILCLYVQLAVIIEFMRQKYPHVRFQSLDVEAPFACPLTHTRPLTAHSKQSPQYNLRPTAARLSAGHKRSSFESSLTDHSEVCRAPYVPLIWYHSVQAAATTHHRQDDDTFVCGYVPCPWRDHA